MHLKYIFLILCCVSLIGCEKTQQKNKTTTTITTKPASLYTDLEGNAVKLSDFKGKRILLNFWATWCTPCIKEMPSMAKAQEILKDENYIFLFATTDALKKVTHFKENNPYPFQYLQFTSSLDKLNIYALPATFIYDTHGKMVKRMNGATEWNSEEILNQLKTIQ